MTFSKASTIALRHCQKALGVKGLKAEKPRQGEHGDVAVALFEAAKQLRQNPAMLAQKIAEQKPPKEFSQVQAVGPYANFFYSQKFVAKELEGALKQGFGNGKEGKGKKAVVEYSQPNPGKPMHLGHIRSTILGDVAARLLSATGFYVVRMNYLNDRGAHIAELITALSEFKELPEVRDEKGLMEYYVKIKKEIEAKPELKQKSVTVLTKIDAGDAETMARLRQIREMSLAAFQRNYSTLGIEFDEVVNETTLLKDAMKTVGECLKKKIAFVDKDGTTIADLEKHGLPNTVLLRSNNSPIYLTSDLALADYKWRKYRFDESVYFTASEQNLHFQQLFKILSLLKRPFANQLRHVGFGLISLPEGKMSTRQGRVILLEDVLSEAVGFARAEVEKRERTEEIDEVSKAIGVGSLKFAFLRISPEKTITFDPKKAVEFEGDTGAYVQYSHVRCASILQKAGGSKAKKMAWLDLHEERLAKKIIEFPDIIAQSARSLQPHVLCDYLLALSHEFNSFYANCQVLESERKEERLVLVAAAKNALGKGLSLLGIKAIEKM